MTEEEKAIVKIEHTNRFKAVTKKAVEEDYDVLILDTFYIFPCVKNTGMTGEEFAVRLLDEKKVAVVPGNAFGEFGKYYVRISYAYSMKNLVAAMERIAEFVKALRKK